MSKDSLLFLTKEDFDQLKFPKGLRDKILSELNKGIFLLNKFLQGLIDQALKLTPLTKEMANLKVENVQIDQMNLEHREKNDNNQNGVQKPETDVEEKSPDQTKIMENIVGLRGFIQECSDFEEALEVLNAEGSKNGIAFKRGNIHYFENSKNAKDKRIICVRTSRNKPRNNFKESDKKVSLDHIKDFKDQDFFNCPVYYKFSFSKEDGKMSFCKCNEVHNHKLALSGAQLTQEMLQDLKFYNKKSKIIDIKEALEKKYNVLLDYHVLYYEFRKIFPRFGNEDANNFINILKQKNVYHKIDLIENKVNRLFFATPRMIRNYELYGNIILIDSTYRVNQYNIPLVVYSGIDASGRNIIFALSLVNDETETTYSWCINEFFSLYIKQPHLIVTDQDLALSAVLAKEYSQIIHLLCQWHIKQNLRKHFSFL